MVLNKFLFFLSLSAFLFRPVILTAATGNVVGKVIDEDSFSLPGANIVLSELNTGTSTDPEGQFRLTNLPVGEYTIKVLFIGYIEQQQKVRIEANSTSHLDFVLKAGVVELAAITVVGERLKGQAKALNQQKNNFNITNIISSDQIGRFPDQNIGDALKRIPGFSVNYNQGEARYANVRGTPPWLNSIMINGERMPSAEAEIRSVQLDLLPSEMIQSIEVSKAVTPDMDADAIGGAINLITRQAPNSRRISVTLASGYNFFSHKPMLNGSFVSGQRFFDNKLGVVLSGSSQDHRLGSDNCEGSWKMTKKGVIFPDEWQIRLYHIRRLRQSISLAADYSLDEDENNTLFFDIIYNHRKDWENRYRLKYELEEPDENGQSQKSEIFRETKAGTPNLDNARLEDQRTASLSIRGKHYFPSLMEIKWSISYADASEERPHERYMEWHLKDVPVTVDIFNPRTPYLYENFSCSDFDLDTISEEFQDTKENDIKAKIDLELPIIHKGKYKNKLTLGAKFKGKNKKRKNILYEFEPVGPDTLFYNNMISSPVKNVTKDNFLAGQYRMGQFTNEEFIAERDYDDSKNYEKDDKPSQYAAANFTAEEDVSSAYIMLDQDLGKKLKVKVGFRFESTKLQNRGNQYDKNTKEVAPISGQKKYANILPGLHLKYELDDQTLFRCAYTNTIGRPNFYDLIPFRKISKDNEELEVGNPSLKPTFSKNIDLNVERYFSSIGLLSIGLFNKNMTDFIFIYNANDYLDPVSGNTFDEFFQPRNGAKAAILGFEVAYQRQLTFLPGIFSNLGVYINYTFINSKTDNPEFGKNQIELPGAAPHTLNANLTYQGTNCELGLSFNYTSPYLDPDEVDLTPGLQRYYDKVTYLDLNGSYILNNQFRLFFEANNLLNQPLRYYAGTAERTYQQEFYSSRITAGIKYNY